jgi:hypothetical protein
MYVCSCILWCNFKFQLNVTPITHIHTHSQVLQPRKPRACTQTPAQRGLYHTHTYVHIKTHTHILRCFDLENRERALKRQLNVAVTALDHLGRPDSASSSQHSRQADSATSSLYSRQSTASLASTASYQSRVDTYREAPRSLELHDALHSLGEALNLATSNSSSSCAVENADYNKIANQTRDNTTVNKCGNGGKSGAYNSNAIYGSSASNGVYSLSSSRSSSTSTATHTSSTNGAYVCMYMYVYACMCMYIVMRYMAVAWWMECIVSRALARALLQLPRIRQALMVRMYVCTCMFMYVCAICVHVCVCVCARA